MNTPRTDREIWWVGFKPDEKLEAVWADFARDLEKENADLRKDKERLDFLATLTGSGWACLHLNRKGTNDDWLLTRKQIDRRMATEAQP